MTTNCPDKLDEALVRPGRVDLRARFHHASRNAIQGVFCNFFGGVQGLTDSELREAAAVFASSCAEAALPVAAIQAHLMQFRDDPWAAARSTPPDGSREIPARSTKQFIVPRGAATLAGEEE